MMNEIRLAVLLMGTEEERIAKEKFLKSANEYAYERGFITLYIVEWRDTVNPNWGKREYAKEYFLEYAKAEKFQAEKKKNPNIKVKKKIDFIQIPKAHLQ